MRVDETYEGGALVRALTHNGDGTGTLAELVDGQWVETAVDGLPVVAGVPYVDPAEELRSAMLDALAPLTPSSSSPAVRTALLALKAALA